MSWATVFVSTVVPILLLIGWVGFDQLVHREAAVSRGARRGPFPAHRRK